MSETPANYEFLETLCICKGDSVDNANNLSHAEAYERAREITNLQSQGKYMSLKIVSGKIQEPQKIVIYGESGVGKTTMGAEFPKALIIDAERSSTHLDTPRVFVNNWLEVIAALKEIPALAEYKTIVIDTIDWVENACVNHFKIKIMVNKDYGRSYVELKEQFVEIVKLLDAIIASGKHVVLLAHNALKKVELPDELGQFDRHELKLTKLVAPFIAEWADAMLFMYRKTHVEISDTGKAKAKGGKVRRFITNDNAVCIAKNRWGLQDEIRYPELFKD